MWPFKRLVKCIDCGYLYSGTEKCFHDCEINRITTVVKKIGTGFEAVSRGGTTKSPIECRMYFKKNMALHLNSILSISYIKARA
jgi:hypothetical protein